MFYTIFTKLFPISLLVFISSTPLYAASEINGADTAWMMASTALVLLMVPGLALFYGGMVRTNNVLSAIMHSMVAMGAMSLQWFVIGYSLSWGSDIGGFIGGLDYIFLRNVGVEANGTIPHVLFMMFQGMFAIITPALIGGAVVERIKFSAWIWFIILWGTLVYDPLCHMVWHSEGFLLMRGSLDFAGGTVVHISSGISALVLAIIIGKRKKMVPPHNLILTVIGAALLWFGWFGFNAGSALSAGALAANALVATHLAAASGLFSWVLIEWYVTKKPSVLGAASGVVAGLVAITPGAGFVTPSSAVIIGTLGGIVCFFGVRIKNKLGFDDALDAFGVHGVGGIFGALATGFFATKLINPAAADGIFYDSLLGSNLLFEQVLAIAVTISYAVIMTWIIAKVLDKTIGLRVDEETEKLGLDERLHGEHAYHY